MSPFLSLYSLGACHTLENDGMDPGRAAKSVNSSWQGLICPQYADISARELNLFFRAWNEDNKQISAEVKSLRYLSQVDLLQLFVVSDFWEI